jgi:hypothetical protein
VLGKGVYLEISCRRLSSWDAFIECELSVIDIKGKKRIKMTIYTSKKKQVKKQNAPWRCEV